jgi:hypothetical protein
MVLSITAKDGPEVEAQPAAVADLEDPVQLRPQMLGVEEERIVVAHPVRILRSGALSDDGKVHRLLHAPWGPPPRPAAAGQALALGPDLLQALGEATGGRLLRFGQGLEPLGDLGEALLKKLAMGVLKAL